MGSEVCTSSLQGLNGYCMPGKHPTDELHLLPPVGFSNPFSESCHPTAEITMQVTGYGTKASSNGWTLPGMEADPCQHLWLCDCPMVLMKLLRL